MLLEGDALLLGSLLRGVHAQRAGIIGPGGEGATTLADAAMEEALGEGRAAEEAAADGTSTLASDGDLRGIATEVGNVALYPLEGVDLIEQSVVA